MEYVMQIKFEEIKTRITLTFSPDVIQHFYSNRQINLDYEVGGQLFARFLAGGEVLIEKVTGPRDVDSKLRNFFKPDKRIEQQEINTLFKEGYHYLGDWHTHPEKTPSPSIEDIKNIGNIFRKSRHSLNHFVLVIVGQIASPDGLYVALHDGVRIKPCRQLTSIPSQSSSYNTSELNLSV